MASASTQAVLGKIADSSRYVSLAEQSIPGATRESQSLALKSDLFGCKSISTNVLSSSSKVHDARSKNRFEVRAGLGRDIALSLQNLLGGILHLPNQTENAVVYKGVASIAKKRVAVSNLAQTDLVDLGAAVEDKAYDIVGQKIEIQLVSVDLDQSTKAPKLSATSTVDGWATNPGDLDLVADDDSYSISFQVPKDFGQIGAFVIKNNHKNQFFLKDLKLQAPDKSTIVFNTLAWIYPHDDYPKNRVFFSSKMYLPSETPAGLKALRQQELEQTRGDGTGTRQKQDRIYDYDVYNDIGDPDKDISLKRPVLGGSQDLPYPRRCRTGRPKSTADPASESRIASPIEVPYIPSDEFFLRTKNSTFIAVFLKSFFHSVLPAIKTALSGETSFKSVDEINQLYRNGLPIRVPSSLLSSDLTPDISGQRGNLVYLSTFFAAKGQDQSVVVYPKPDVIVHDATAWETDEEFGRQTLAGLHATVIKALTEYPPKSGLDSAQYGAGTSLKDEHILPYLEGLSVAEAIKQKKLFTIDYHDAFLPLVGIANADTNAGFQCYAPRTIFFNTSDGKMLPIAIELSLPPTGTGGKSVNRVFTPADADDHLWDLAKIHVNAMDSNYHQVYSHFTLTHAVMEPFIIATKRQLSAMHPVYSLLDPHFKDTMNINSAAREILINAQGVIETAFSLGTHAMTAGSKAYGAFWRFDQLSPPQALLSRGMAVAADKSYPGGVKLVVEDYPWAKDALDVWNALYNWTETYLRIAYKGSDDAVKQDTELQAWWQEVINVGHGDFKNATWWPKLDSIKSLANVVATIGFTAGPFHASVNFGQWAYAGYPLNKPTGTRRFIPEKNSAEYNELQNNPEAFLLSTINSPSQATSVMTVLELLATHSVDEEYIGTLSLSWDWNTSPQVADAFRQFSDAVAKVQQNITDRNKDKTLINRSGPAQVPYTLFFPSSTSGLTGKGVPYSTSI